MEDSCGGAEECVLEKGWPLTEATLHCGGLLVLDIEVTELGEGAVVDV